MLYNSETWTLKEEQKRKLRVFEMSVLRKICGITRRARRRNTDVLKELNIEKDIVQVLQTRRLTYCTLVMWTACNRSNIHMCFYVVILTVTVLREDQKRSGSTTSVNTAPTWTFHYIRGFSTHFGQDIMEEHCSAYVLPTRGVIATVATAVSHVGLKSMWTL